MTHALNRRSLLSVMSGLGATAALGRPATAQVLVYDPTNYAQNILQATRALQTVNNQIMSLQNEAQSLINQARNLTALPISVLADLQQTINNTRQLIGQAQHIAYDVSRIDHAFQSLYGSVSLTASDTAMVTDARTRWQNTVGALQDALRTQATVVGNIGATQDQMTALVNASQSATGALGVAQAGNQLLALQSHQLMDLIALLAAHGRAAALKDAESSAAVEQAREQRRRFLTAKSGYQPGNAQMFYGD
ncbi:hypothetical protein MMA231_04163 (plasmid) [Asticcacaulis sp. MM231]|uniref:P-type conjugative transfer protein TrbJ n=1 Tax=Asticcacaulis sp. MM231 TaxID=3157666 RepID=UPI0032D5A658